MGSGQCAFYAPNTFSQDELLVAIVIDPEGDPEEAIQTAIKCCPTQAISMVEVPSGGESQQGSVGRR
jgi:ferredoxin